MSWQFDVETFWSTADDSEPDAVRRDMQALLATHRPTAGRELFELASVEDFLGNEEAAVPLYRRALEEPLDSDIEQQARIQLASSLRNVGRPQDALDVLVGYTFAAEYASARDAFVALAQWDSGDPGSALRSALRAAHPSLGRYARAIGAYADELADRADTGAS